MTEKILTLNGLPIGGANPVRVMGVINLSPESFYAESIITDQTALVSRVEEMVGQGADIIDIGGASTAPKNYYDTKDTGTQEELSRVTSALELIVKASSVPISIDTTSSSIAEAALDLGASIVNDISGLHADKMMAGLAADRNVPIVIMANCPNHCESVEASLGALKSSLEIANEAGIPKENVILDPGIGFGKPPDVDFALLKQLGRFKDFQRPILVGVSRKAFIGALLGEDNPERRLAGTVSATSVAVVNGADIIRAHDVAEAVVAARVGEALR
ncbi:MAG: dihydropteroate synthase [Candidatus Thorarchaeota archaeon]|nr:dihydropteroate synthase [Candidatus Thorarchaeota archaeon]